MPSVEISPFNIEKGYIDVNLIEINGKTRTEQQHNDWELHDEKKMGFLNTNIFGEWETAKLRILGDIEDKKVAKAIAIIHCRWTNFTSYVELEENKESEKDGFKYSYDFLLNRAEFSSKVVFVIKFLDSRGITIGVSSEFSVFVDNREPPELDSGLFEMIDANFSEEGDWSEYVKKYKGDMFFSSIRQPEHDKKLTIYYNIDFPGLSSDIQDETVEEPLRSFFKLFTIYLGSGGFVSECVAISFYLNSIKKEERVNQEYRSDLLSFREDIVEKIEIDFESEDLLHSPLKIKSLAYLIYPDEKNEKDRLLKWWEDSNESTIYTLLERIHMAYQKMVDPHKKFGKSISELIYDDDEEEKIDE